MTPALIGVLPDDFTRWKIEVIKLPDRIVATGRRSGVTIQLVHVDDWWHVTKMHKGQILVQKTVKNLPSAVADDIERRRRNGRA